MLIKAEYIDRFKIIKSQMAFDFSSPLPPSAKHEEVHTVRATTRHLASGTVSQVQAHQRRTEVATPTGAQTIEARKINARDRFEQSLQTIAGITPEQATRVADYYVKHKLVKTDANVGQMNPVHGAYLDKNVILPKRCCPDKAVTITKKHMRIVSPT